MTQPDPIPTEQVFGIAKKYTLEMEKHPLQTHAAIVGILRMMVDHRQVTLQNEAQAEEVKAREKAMEDARAAHARAAAQREDDDRAREERRAARLKADIADIAKVPDPAGRAAQAAGAELEPKLVLASA
jgi:hypothetical protein